MSEKLFNVGKVVNTHGIRGELKIVSQTDFPEQRFGKGSKLVLADPNNEANQLKVEVEGGRLQKNVYIIKFKGYNEINEVLPYKGWMLKISEAEREPLEKGQYYYHEIIGCQVVSDEGETLGTISEILSPGANHVWVVERENGKPILLPVIDDVILEVDTAAKQVRVHLMEGLID
jgi:16S rRNA processing protein RimM